MSGSSAGQGSSLAKSSKRASASCDGIQQAGHRIARKVPGEALDRSPRPLANRPSTFRISVGQLPQSLMKTGRIQLVDGEDADAALRAAGLADQPISAAAGGVGQRGVEDLYQLGVA